jgi:Cu2+-exporting ATPase
MNLSAMIGYPGSNGKALIQALSAPGAGLPHHVTEDKPSRPSLWSGIKQALTTLDNEYQRLVKQHIDPLFGASRLQQMREIAGDEDRVAITSDEKNLNRTIGASLIITGTALMAGNAVAPIVLICFPLAIYSSRVPLQRAYRSIFHERRLTMPVVASLNLIGTWLGGFYFAGGLGLVIFFMAEKLIFISEDKSRQKLVNIFGQQPRFVWTVVDGVEVEIPFEQLQAGDTVVIGAGQMIPVDGVIRSGHASVDQHRLTGESQPAEKASGERVLAATVVLAGKIYVEVEKAGHETVAAQIGDILNNTASYQMAMDSKAMQVVNASVVPTLVAAGLAWLWVSFEGAVAITNSAIGFNIRLTGPIAMLNYLNLASQRGILVKDGRSLELLNSVDTVIFDKTGTLTLEQPHVARVHTFNGADEATILAYAAAAEDRQPHPIARAIVAAATGRGLVVPAIGDARYEVGYGIKAWIDNQLIRVGSDRFMVLETIEVPPAVKRLQADCHAQGHSLVMVAIDGELAGAIELEPTLRPEAKSVIQALHRRGIEVYIISGDQEEPTRKLARELEIDHYFANTLPEDKAKHVERLQAEKRNVCFVGDGINDSIALKKAQVSISLRGATTVATDTAQVVLMDASLAQLPGLFALANQFDTNMKVGFAAAIIPGFFIFGGVFLVHLGLIGSILIYNASLLTGVGVAMLPLLQSKNGE